MFDRRRAGGVVVFAVLLSPAIHAVQEPRVPSPAAPPAKVDGSLLESARQGATVDVLVWMREQADLTSAARLQDKEARGRLVTRRLRRVAARTQAPLLRDLEARSVVHRPFWIANMVAVRADLDLIHRLAARPEVGRLLGDPKSTLPRPRPLVHRSPAAALEPNLARIGVRPVFWRRGVKGEGVVIGIADTGFDWLHPALRSSYRGAAMEGEGATHDYNWFDGAGGLGGPACGPPFAEPCDDHGHGTRTLGLMVGLDGPQARVGVAPGARWIGCRNMDNGVGTPSSYAACFQWFLAPTDRRGDEPDPSMAPDVINNSWLCTPAEGCGDPIILQRVVEAVRAAGIVVVAAAGNDGPVCSTLARPPAIYGASLTVGSVDLDDVIAPSSSRGPVTVDGSGRMKPDLVAPGVAVRTSVPGGGYAASNGTSMAAPQVAGMAALLISSADCLRGDVAAIEEHLRATAEPIPAAQVCGGVAADATPNPVYGAGSLRAAVPSCPAGVGGRAEALAARKLVCRDRSGGGRSTVRLGGGQAWRCDGGGFAPDPGDRVKVRLLGEVLGGADVTGTVRELALQRVVCRNRSTRQRVRARVVGAGEWDCTAAGLQADPGDSVLEILVGLKSRSRP